MTYLLLTHLHLLRLALLRFSVMRPTLMRFGVMRRALMRFGVMRPVWSGLTRHPRVVLAGLFLGLTAHPAVVHACAVCVGDPNDPQTKGASAAVLLLMGITGCVLSCFVAFFGYLWWRGRRPLDSAITCVGSLQDKLREEEARS